MLSIAYVSVATTPMSDEDIAGILSQSRANNIRHELTGALLFHRGRYIQILEGPDDKVNARFEIIAADPRHRSVQKVSEMTILRRQFPEWTMGFRPITDDSLKALEGFDDFFDSHTAGDRLKHANNDGRQLLEWIAEYWFEPSAVTGRY